VGLQVHQFQLCNELVGLLLKLSFLCVPSYSLCFLYVGASSTPLNIEYV